MRAGPATENQVRYVTDAKALWTPRADVNDVRASRRDFTVFHWVGRSVLDLS